MMNLQRPRFDPPIPEEVCRGCGSGESALSPARVCSECQSACHGCGSPTGMLKARLCTSCWRKSG